MIAEMEQQTEEIQKKMEVSAVSAQSVRGMLGAWSCTGSLPSRPSLRKRFAGGLAICKAFFKIRRPTNPSPRCRNRTERTH